VSKPNFYSYQRRLPHWRLDGATYFVTWRLAVEQTDLTPEERSVVVSALHYFDEQRYGLFAFVVMNDHTRVLVAPAPNHQLQDIVHSWKSFTAHTLRQNGRCVSVWQDEYFDRIVRDELELAEKARYILANPWKRWPACDEYPWVWAKGIED
jgi:putative transposase